MLDSLGSLLAVVVVAAAAPILVAFLPGRVPQVVLLISCWRATSWTPACSGNVRAGSR
ncbi:MAG: hypothetical protein ACXWF5_06895 [Actinomycetota bacterium]